MMDERFKNVLIYDCESAATLGSPTSTHKLRIFACYSYNDDKFYLLYKQNDIRDIVNRHKYLVGFNNAGGTFHKDFFEGYDNQLLYFNGFDDIITKGSDLCYRFNKKINIDLMMIIKKRASAMKIKKGMLGDLLMRYSLDYITRTVGLVDDDSAKKELDYSLLAPEVDDWTSENKKLIEEYTLRDLEITKKLYEWIENYFKSFRDYMIQEDIDSKKYLTCSTAVFTYKAVCKAMGWKEEYSDVKEKQSYGGGYVSYPSVEHASGKIYCFDFSSLYPSIMHMSNIFSPTNEGWNGAGKFNVEGIYNNKEQGNVEKLIKGIYEQRLVYKKLKDPREYSLKIQMNACFDKDTDILLDRGIVNIKDCKNGDLAYSINKTTGETELKEIIDIQKIPYSNEMIHFKSKNTDLMVTPDHNMLYKRIKSSPIETIKASEFIKKTYNSPISILPYNGIKTDVFDIKEIIDTTKCLCFIKLDDPYSQRQNKLLSYDRGKRMHLSINGYNKNLKGKWFFQTRNKTILVKEYYPIKEFFYLIGIMISEGSVYKSIEKHYNNRNYRGICNRITISQHKDVNLKTYNKICSILDKLTIKYSMYPKAICVASDILSEFYLKYIGRYSKNKQIPPMFFKYDHSILQYLHDGLYDGDGNKNEYRYTTNSNKLKNDMIRLNFLLGYRTTISYDSNAFRIYRTGAGLTIRPHRKNFSIIKNNDDYVYCVTVKDNHTVYVGRNGKLNWCGQCYGLLGNPSFSHLYNRTSAADVTRLGRQFVKLARKRFMEFGYNVIYTDTDSVYLVDTKDNKEELFNVKKKIVEEIQSAVPFPYPKQKKVIDGVEVEVGFDMGLDAEITDMFFFKGDVGEKETDSEMDEYDHVNKPKKLIKKNYIYRKIDGSIGVKNLGVRKKSLSAISRKLFWDILVPKISNEKKVKFSEAYIRDTIDQMLKEDISLAEQRFSIKPFDAYKLESQMQAQISKKLGPGIHFLIPVKRDIYKAGELKTIGINKKYIESEEFKNLGLTVNDIDISKVWAELNYFIKDSQSTLASFFA